MIDIGHCLPHSLLSYSTTPRSKKKKEGDSSFGVKSRTKKRKKGKQLLVFPPRGPPPNLVGVPLAFCLGHVPRDEDEEQGGQAGKDEVHHALAQPLVHHGEELGDHKGGDPVGGQGPALGGPDRLGAHEFAAQDEGDGAEAEGEAGDEQQHRHGAEDRDGAADAEGQQDARRAHARDAAEDAGLAAEDVGQGREGRGGDDVEHAHEDVEQGRVGGQEARQQGHAVHDDAVDAAELLGHHDHHHGEDGPVVFRVEQDRKDADVGGVR